MLGLWVAPKISKMIAVPKNILLPVVTVLCVVGAFACNNRLFDVGLMFLFGLMGFLMRRRGYPAAPLVLALVLGKMMDSNFRRAVSLAAVKDNPMLEMFGHPITIILLICTVGMIVSLSLIHICKYLFSSLDASLKRLQLDYVDIFYHHRPDPETPLELSLIHI